MKHFYLYMSILFLNFSCETKNDYLADYQNFMNEVKTNWKSYSDNEWITQSEIFESYNKESYKKFKGDLSPSEKLKIVRYEFCFNFYKGDISIKKLFAGEYNQILGEYLQDFWDEIQKIWNELLEGIADIRSEGIVTIVNQMM